MKATSACLEASRGGISHQYRTTSEQWFQKTAKHQVDLTLYERWTAEMMRLNLDEQIKIGPRPTTRKQFCWPQRDARLYILY